MKLGDKRLSPTCREKKSSRQEILTKEVTVVAAKESMRQKFEAEWQT